MLSDPPLTTRTSVVDEVECPHCGAAILLNHMEKIRLLDKLTCQGCKTTSHVVRIVHVPTITISSIEPTFGRHK